MHKEVLSAAAIALTFVLFLPYIRSIQSGKVQPHVFSWVIWAAGTFIVFLAQLAGRGGLGAWPIGVSGIITGYIALLAYRKRGDTHITRADWAFLLAAFSALPFWFFTSDPVWAVIVLTVSDLIGFGPTVRRAYTHPYEESIAFFTLCAVRNLLVVLALEHYSLTTVLFPAAVGLACLLLSAMLAYRRRLVPGHSDKSRLSTNP
jgi:hypothetical protein